MGKKRQSASPGPATVSPSEMAVAGATEPRRMDSAIVTVATPRVRAPGREERVVGEDCEV